MLKKLELLIVRASVLDPSMQSVFENTVYKSEGTDMSSMGVYLILYAYLFYAYVLLLLLKISFSSMKALSGLQFLLHRVRILQESGSKFSLSGLYIYLYQVPFYAQYSCAD